jgi:REP element-mobilizing transposase RayT
MPNTYTQLYIQFVFAVKYRSAVINASWKDDLYKYITGIVQNQKHKLLSINGMPDHIHILVGLHPSQSISELLQDIKGSSSKWINEKGFIKGKFEWQEGYGAFSYSKSHLKNVIHYIENQEEHHTKKSFREEYVEFLVESGIDYDERFIFKDPV